MIIQCVVKIHKINIPKFHHNNIFLFIIFMENIKNKFISFTFATVNLAFWVIMGACVGYYSSLLGESSVATVD